jgi:hypothetical protein
VGSCACNGWGWHPNLTLLPGEGGFLHNTNAACTLVFGGDRRTPVLPVAIPAGQLYLLSRQDDDVADYEGIMGFSPTEGAVLIQWNAASKYYDLFYCTGFE